MSKNRNKTVDNDGEGEAERLTSEEFLDLIPHLSFAQILQVEVFWSGCWRPLIREDCSKKTIGQKMYNCTVCNAYQKVKNMIVHIGGRKHVTLMQAAKDIYHPEYTYPKSKKLVESNTSSKASNEQKLPEISNEVSTKQSVKSNSFSVPKEQSVPEKSSDETPKQLSKSTPFNMPKEPSVPEISSDVDPPTPAKNLVINPLTLNRAKEAATAKAKKTQETAKTVVAEKPTTSEDDNEIPEVIIIDDYDDDQMTKQANKESPEKELEPRTKKPRIMVSSFAKCIDSSDDDTSTKKNSSNAKSPTKKSTNADDDDKNKIHGFIGVEYVVKICGNKMATRYECGLCERNVNLNFDDMQKHLLGYSHRLKFCEKHFPTAIQQFRQYIVDVPADEHYKVMIPVLQKLAEAIEKHHGRAQPYECNPHRFNAERIRVLTEVFARAHASEQDGPTFTHVINSKDVDEFISKRDSFNHQDKVVKAAVFDILKASNSPSKSSSHSNIPVVKRNNNKVDSAPIVKMANAMRMHFQMSQPYHIDGPLSAQPYMEPQPYMGQQPYMHQPPFMEPAPFMPPAQFMPMVDDETHKRMVDRFLRATSKDDNTAPTRPHRNDRNDRHDRHDRNDRHGRNEKQDRNSARSSHRSRSPHRTRSPPRSSSTFHTATSKTQQCPEIWRSYCRLVTHKQKALDECYQQYKSNPESHPSYNEEWLKFWHRRKGELIAQGKDYRTHDYQPEWVVFFNNRIKELYEEAFETLKIQSREELSLPMTNEFLVEVKYYVHAKPTENKTLELSSIVDFELPTQFNKTHASNPPISNTVDLSREAHEKKSTNSTVSIRIKDEETPTFVSVLRLMTALEEHLGSLGPKIVNLLTKALQAEKCSPAHGLALINEENCTLLETAMEKFKGLVIAGILDSAKERAVKKAIAKVTVFLDVAKKTRELVAKRTTPTLKPVNDEVPKKQQAIEEKIAALLAAQGQTNFDREKLEQLATVCMLLDKKKREAATTTSAASTSQAAVQKPLSDALSDIMGNLGSSSMTARKPTTNRHADSANTRPSRSTDNQYQHMPSSASSYFANGNSMNTNRNFGNTHADNVPNFVPQMNRTNEPMMNNRWQYSQEQQNIPSNSRWGPAWGPTDQTSLSYPNQSNRLTDSYSSQSSRPPMGRGPYM